MPVIATKVGAFPELLDEGKTGYLVEPGNVGEMAEKIDKLISNKTLLTRFSKASRKRMVTNFDLSVEADRLIEIYREI